MILYFTQISIISVGININLMKNKTKSCERCILRKVITQPTEPIEEEIEVSAAYMTKKISQLHKQDIKWKAKRKKLAEEKQKMLELKEMEKCTFQPIINPNTSDFYQPTDPFLKRQKHWKNNIDRKILKQRQLKDKQEAKKLTFKPKISKVPAFVKELAYSNRTKLTEKTYRDIYIDKQKFNDSKTIIFQEPFQHRRVKSMIDGYFELNNSLPYQKLQKTQRFDNPEDYVNWKGLMVKQVQEKEQLIEQHNQG